MLKLSFRTTVAALATLVACGQAESPPCSDCEPTASGGSNTAGNASAAGNGSTGSSTGIAGDASGAGTTSTGGSGNSGGNIGSAGAAGDTNVTNVGGGFAECSPPQGAPVIRGGFIRSTGATGGAPASGGAGGADSGSEGGSGGDAKPCESTAWSEQCEGEVRVGGTQSAPQLTFADGTVLTYSSSVIAAPVFSSDRAWVRLRDDHDPSPCHFSCGFSSYALEVRSTRGGQLLFIELSGGFPERPSEDVLAQVFGAQLREIPLCQTELTRGCEVVTRRRLDLAVGTVPEQLLRHGEVSAVTSSSGDRFDVLVSWSADQSAIVPPNCADLQPVPRDRMFIASRLAP